MDDKIVFGWCQIPGCYRESNSTGYVMVEAPVIGPYPRHMEVCFVHAQQLVEITPVNKE